ncbi:MAG: hypothetical protein KC656_13005 [Myxococcales bacterium]|nr:hypothetical protein [Myxococcales bacterium]MCB9665882.1 hypothetical protein [Alphaproteobacteria bacterium]
MAKKPPVAPSDPRATTPKKGWSSDVERRIEAFHRTLDAGIDRLAKQGPPAPPRSIHDLKLVD